MERLRIRESRTCTNKLLTPSYKNKIKLFFLSQEKINITKIRTHEIENKRKLNLYKQITNSKL
jgi:hypothetical protein